MNKLAPLFKKFLPTAIVSALVCFGILRAVNSNVTVVKKITKSI